MNSDALIARARDPHARTDGLHRDLADALVAAQSASSADVVAWIDRTLELPVYATVKADSYGEGVVEALKTVRKLITKSHPRPNRSE